MDKRMRIKNMRHKTGVRRKKERKKRFDMNQTVLQVMYRIREAGGKARGEGADRSDKTNSISSFCQ